MFKKAPNIGHRFVKGHPGIVNAGRPALPPELKKFGPRAWDKIMEMAKSAKSPKIRFMANCFIVEHIYGKAVQRDESNSKNMLNQNIIQITVKDKESAEGVVVDGIILGDRKDAIHENETKPEGEQVIEPNTKDEIEPEKQPVIGKCESIDSK